ncbi:unnamed protein product [Darwinula stevensoni]|uniref:G-protein coupled receptors family 2 profile 2 domain-containing protein n=1 Tax=Darwinula stevensoni TaxID=69355 RepID=A0A7R9A4C3_9CRUS|nr:unnamed protein product [Darwinula stevensoni]CAG0893326.1 unnamed protein product [Darwinula stevensoni]
MENLRANKSHEILVVSLPPRRAETQTNAPRPVGALPLRNVPCIQQKAFGAGRADSERHPFIVIEASRRKSWTVANSVRIFYGGTISASREDHSGLAIPAQLRMILPGRNYERDGQALSMGFRSSRAVCACRFRPDRRCQCLRWIIAGEVVDAAGSSRVEREVKEERRVLVQKCCPLDEGSELFLRKCNACPFEWNLPVFNQNMSEIHNLSRVYRRRIDDMASIPCGDDGLPPNANDDPWEEYYMVQDTGYLYVPNVNSTISNELSCSEHFHWERSWINVTRVCHPTEMIPDCTGKVCVQKCCHETEMLHESEGWYQCGPGERKWDFRELLRTYLHSDDSVHVSTGFPICPRLSAFLIPLMSVLGRSFFLTRSGGLIQTGRHTFGDEVVRMPSYCIDACRNCTSSLEPIALICPPIRMVSLDLPPFPTKIMLMLVSALVLFVTFLLSCHSLKRKKLSGGTRLFYLTCLLLSYIFLCAAEICLSFGVCNAFCPASVLAYHYGFMCVFAWLSAMSYDIWRNVNYLRMDSQDRSKKKLIYYSLFAFGVPACIFAMAYVVEVAPGIPPLSMRLGLKSLTTNEYCRFPDPVGVKLFLDLPFVLLLVADAIFFVRTSRFFARHSKDTADLRRNQKHERKFWMYAKLFVLMGGNWVIMVIIDSVRRAKLDLSENAKFALMCLHHTLLNLQTVFVFFIFACSGDAARRRMKNAWAWLRGCPRVGGTPGSSTASSNVEKQLGNVEADPRVS